MGSQQTIKPQTGLIRVPLNYPSVPTPGKLQLLLENNEKSIYHRYSPYAEYANGLVDKILGFGAKQPFIYDYIDKARKGLSGLRRFEGRIFPIGSAPRDVIRVSKFLASGPGILFLGKQFLLQTTNAFNETRIYNPTSPIVAAGMGLTLGMVRPQRNIDINGGLGGLARSVIGNTIPNLFGSPTVSPPYGTIGSSLPISNSSGGKGLLRAQTANRAKSILESRWNNSKSKKSGLLGLAKSLFSNFIPQKQDSKIRSDEGAYGLMIGGGWRFGYLGNSGAFDFTQLWFGGGKLMRKNKERNAFSSRIYNSPDGKTSGITIIKNLIQGNPSYIAGVGRVEVEIKESTIESKPGIRYGDSVGASISDRYSASEIMVDYSVYSQPGTEFPTKKSDKLSIEKLNETLSKVIVNLKKSGVYEIISSGESIVLPNGTNNDPLTNGYNKIFQIRNSKGMSAMQYTGVLADYRDKNIRMVDNSITNDRVNKSLKLPGAGNFDAINTLRILPGKNSEIPRFIQDTQIPNWTTWSPYKDDQIAFFFYDVVNDKYIPFRATVKGISESSTAHWEELAFLGRADKLFSYSGFSRTLSFNFDIVIGSIIELAPTWKRINYLMSLSKPAGYTKSKQGTSLPYNKFMIPPMVMITIGDLYKEQPIIITQLSMIIPEDADWETLNEENSNKKWSYLSDYIKSSNAKIPYGQFPMEAKLTVTCNLLEKERAIMGAANFGHAPHTDKYLNFEINGQPHIHQTLVEYQFDHATPPTWVDHKVVSPNSTDEIHSETYEGHEEYDAYDNDLIYEQTLF